MHVCWGVNSVSEFVDQLVQHYRNASSLKFFAPDCLRLSMKKEKHHWQAWFKTWTLCQRQHPTKSNIDELFLAFFIESERKTPPTGGFLRFVDRQEASSLRTHSFWLLAVMSLYPSHFIDSRFKTICLLLHGLRRLFLHLHLALRSSSAASCDGKNLRQTMWRFQKSVLCSGFQEGPE